MTVYVSDLFTATPAAVNASPTSTRTWQWLRGSSAISGATSSTYTAVTADIGSTLSATQLETNFLATTQATSAATEVVQAFDPIRLFSASEPGVWYDPSDMSTLYQNAAGTIPVTSFGQPVGLMLDKSRGLVLGSEKITNGDFSSGTTGWSGWNTNAQISVSGGQMTVTQPVGGNQVGVGNTTAFATVVGRTYAVSLDFVSSVGAVQIRIGDFNGSNNAGTFLFSESAGRKTGYFVANSTIAHVNVATASAAGSTITFDNISVKELPGLHATQSTDASRPLYGIVPVSGRRNLLTQTENFSSADWSKTGTAVPTVTNNYAAAPDGTVTAALLQFGASTDSRLQQTVTVASGANVVTGWWLKATSGTRTVRIGTSLTVAGEFADFTVTTTWAFYSHSSVASFTSEFPIVANQQGTAGEIYIWHPQFEQSATPTAYQRVSTDLDVTEAGVASVGYLRFDGSTSFMVTPTITPGTDKVQVFAGVRKLTSSGYHALVELSANPDGSNGVIGLLYSGSTTVYAQSKGTNYVQAYSSEPVPNGTTNVLTAQADISGPSVSLRSAGVQVALNTASQGTGNYLAYPLYIGRRGGASLEFNGHIHSLIVRFGPTLTTARIAATEAWVATKTGGVTL